MRWLAELLTLLVSAAALGAPAHSDRPDAVLKDIESAANAFVRAVPVPAWADLAAPPPVPAEASRRPVVVRLEETHLHVGALPTRLTNRVVQVNDASALGEIGQMALDFNPRFQRLLLHKVVILRGGESIDHTRTAPVRLLQREARLEQGVYAGVITASIVLPDVRVHDSLQLVHSIVGENPALGERYTERVPWEQPYSVLRSRVTLTAPVHRQIHWRWYGGAGDDGPRPTESLADATRRLRFEAPNLAGASAEPMMPPQLSPLRGLQFSEYANWNEVARWAVPLFTADAALPEHLAPLMDRLRRVSDPEDRASQALQWVQSEIRYWAVAVGEDAMRPQPPAVVLKRAYGDCKDQSLLLSSMLRELGIEARPTMVSMFKRNDPASMLPAPDIFDHVIVQVRLAGREYYLDPTRTGQTGLLSRMGQRFEGAAVLPVDPETHGLVIVRSPKRAEIFRNRMHERLSLASLGAEGRLDVEIQWFGLNAEDLRLSLKRMDAPALRQFVSASYAQQYAGSRLLDEPQVSDDLRLNQLTIHASFAIPRLAHPAAADAWAVVFAPGLGDAMVMPSARTRRFPLNVPSFPVAYHYRIDMDWPDGVTVASAPGSQQMETPHFRLSTTRSVNGNRESRSVEFVAKVGEVPAIEVASLANDLGKMAEQIGGVMLAVGRGAATPARN